MCQAEVPSCENHDAGLASLAPGHDPDDRARRWGGAAHLSGLVERKVRRVPDAPASGLRLDWTHKYPPIARAVLSSSTMKTPGSRIERRSSRARSGLTSQWTKLGGGPLDTAVTAPGTAVRPRLDRSKHERHSCLALAFQHANCALPMLNQRCCGEGGAVSADADKGPGKARLCCLRQIDDLRDICQIVAGDATTSGRQTWSSRKYAR